MPSIMAPLKPPTNFKFKRFFSLVLVNPFSSSKSIVAKTSILLPPSSKFQDGSTKSLFTTGASSSSIVVGVEKPISLDFDHIVPNTKKATKAEWELKRMFQDIWTKKLPWAEAVMGFNGKLSMVKCKVCSFVEKKDKLFIPKFDGLHKHVGRQKATFAKPNVKMGEYFMNLNIQHA
jgi:hypothetical protein